MVLRSVTNGIINIFYKLRKTAAISIIIFVGRKHDGNEGIKRIIEGKYLTRKASMTAHRLQISEEGAVIGKEIQLDNLLLIFYVIFLYIPSLWITAKN